MVEINLGNRAADLGTDVDADLSENDASVTAYAITVDCEGGLAGLGVGLFVKHDLDKRISLCTGQLVASVLEHACDESVSDVVEDEYFLLGNSIKCRRGFIKNKYI